MKYIEGLSVNLKTDHSLLFCNELGNEFAMTEVRSLLLLRS